MIICYNLGGEGYPVAFGTFENTLLIWSDTSVFSLLALIFSRQQGNNC